MGLSCKRPHLLLLAALALFILYYYLPCVLVVAYNYYWWIFYSNTVRLAVPTAGTSQVAVPKILHQTWRDKDVPVKWKAAQESCIAAHPGYEYKLWTDAEADQLIATKFPWFLDAYHAYPHNIQRADVLRYFVLYEYGGIYLQRYHDSVLIGTRTLGTLNFKKQIAHDLDVHCLKSLDTFRDANFTAPKTYPIGLSNDVMISKPKDPFVHQMIRNLAGWQKWLVVRYVTVMFTTGPMYVTVQYSISPYKKDVTVLPADVYGKYNVTSAAYLKHLHGSSWHGGDAWYIFWLEHHGLQALAFIVLLLITAITAAIWYTKNHYQWGWAGGAACRGDSCRSHVIHVHHLPGADCAPALNGLSPSTMTRLGSSGWLPGLLSAFRSHLMPGRKIPSE